VEQLRTEYEQQLRMLESFRGEDSDGVLQRLAKLQVDQLRELNALADLQREIKQVSDQQQALHTQEDEKDAAITAALRQVEEHENATRAFKAKQKMQLRLPNSTSPLIVGLLGCM
jgi:hypothetical protein